MKIARITNDKKVFLGEEIIEYPPELEGGRNLLRDSDFSSGSEYWNGSFTTTNEGALLESVLGSSAYIQNTTLISEGEYTVQIRYRVVEGQAPYLFTTNGTDMSWEKGAYVFEVGDNEWQTATFPVIVNSESRFYAIRYASGLPTDHTEGRTLVKSIKLEKGSQATPWTPAPEDLGFNYPDDIQHFSTGFRVDGTMMVRGLIEVDNKFKVNQILENGDFRNGIQGWNFNSVQNDSVILENGILKFTTDGTIPTTVSGNLVLNHQLEITHKYYGFANVKYIGTMRLKATTYLMEGRANNGEWVKLSGLITSGGTFNRPFGIVILDKVPTDVEVKDLFFINLTETFGEGNEPSKDDCDKMFSNYYQNGGYAELINNNAISLKDGNLLVNELIEGVDL